MSDYLDEEEQIARLKTWWGEYGTTIVVSVVIAVLAIVGWAWYGSYSQDRIYAAAQVYADYEAAEGDEQQSFLQQLSADYSGTAYHVFALLDEAHNAADVGDYEAAVQHLEQAVEASDDVMLADLARIRLSKAQLELDLTSQAQTTLGAVASEGYRALALEAKGDIHARAGEVEAAHAAYQAATDSLLPGDERPFLQMKLDNTAPFGGQYVEFTDSLSEALREAEAAITSNAVAEESQADATPEEATQEETGAEQSDD